ncbi:MAG: DHH family phosphoesterase [Bdellovibrionaceae bacterium]|nr:DHH family phosphoesterase [Pseudobdellovibrionaceae bacterium]
MERIVEAIRNAQTILLTTHRQCDGDGLGAELALYYALKKIGKNVRVINVDETPRKYRFLNPDFHITYFSEVPDLKIEADLCLVFDTNDQRLLEPLFSSVLKPHCKQIAFIDHHPVLSNGPQPTKESLIDISSASTGEMAYRIIKALGIPLDTDIAKALYTSITFDTQLYRYIRNSPTSHRIAAELLEHPIDATNIHRYLFGNQTVQKFAFLAKALGQIEYFCDGQLAVLRVKDADLFHYNLEIDESRDVIDMVMNIESLEAAALFREDSPGEFKVSLRSKGQIEVHGVAELLGGGGHVHAAGASVKGANYADLKGQVVAEISRRLSVSGT